MSRHTFRKKNSNGQPSLDRFVAPRSSFPELRRRMASSPRRESTLDIWKPQYIQQKKYRNYLNEVFGLEPFEDELQTCPTAWPCKPRQRKFLSSADSILDLPDYSFFPFPQLLDWSNDNILVAALGRYYHKWSWRTQSPFSQGVSENTIHCCKFDPTGKLLLLGTDMENIELHDNAMNKLVTGNYCICFRSEHICSVVSVDWSPTGNSFITGCSRGMAVAYDRNACMITGRRVTKKVLIIVRVSPDARYVAMAPVNSDKIMIMSWPMLEHITDISADWMITALAWHPWRSALLGVGAMTFTEHACVALWDAPTAKSSEADLGQKQLCLDNMLFNHKTGEMVVSMWNIDPTDAYQMDQNHLLVMSDAQTVVDYWGEGKVGLDRIRTMIFNPDGTKLATATAGEDLVIWNFLPEDKQKITKRSRFSRLPVYLDQAKHGFSLR